MSPQSDFILDNQTGAQFRADLNNALEAMAGFSSGSTAPTTTYAYQYWADTTNNVLKQRDGSNAGWIVRGKLTTDYGQAGQVLTSAGSDEAPIWTSISEDNAWTVAQDATNAHYTFTGNGFDGTETNPDVYLARGSVYNFTNASATQGFQIQSTAGQGGTAYSDGITSNNVTDGTLVWTVQMDAPTQLYYQSTSDSAPGGNIYVLDESGGGGATSIDGLTDVDTSTVAPTDGQALVWDNGNSQWEPGDVAGSIEWNLTANGTTDYIFAGPGFAGTETDPTIYVVRGQTYEFTNTMGAHPFQIQSTQGTSGTVYSNGITNNGVSNGTLRWEVRMDAPSILYYQCTAHALMAGTIYVIDEGSGGGAVASVNSQTGVVVLDADDIDDTSTTNKFATAAQLTNADNAVQPTDSVSTLNDVNTSGVSNGDVLSYNGTSWVPTSAPPANISSSSIGDLNDVSIGAESEINYTSFDSGQTSFTDPNSSATGGAIDTALGTNAWKVLSSESYGDGSALVGFLSTDKRYDVVNLRVRSSNNIDTNNRLALGGNRSDLTTAGGGFALYTRDSGFGFAGAGSFEEIGTKPTMLADTWYEITYVLDWASAQRATKPNVSLWVDGAIAISNVTLTVSYAELTGVEALNFRIPWNTTAQSNSGDKYWDDISVATGNTIPWSMTASTITNPAALMSAEYEGTAVSDGDFLQWVSADSVFKPIPFGFTRSSVVGTTSSIADAASADLTITSTGKAGQLLSIETDAAAWVTLYVSQATRTADAGRSETADPAPGSGVLSEVITTGAQTVIMTPSTMYFNNEATPASELYLKVVNKSGSTAAITVTLKVIATEV